LVSVRVLSFHAGYRCRNAGACCTSNWPIPIEADRHERLRAAIASDALRTIDWDRPFFVVPEDRDDDARPMLATKHGRCVFHDPSGRCAVQSALGHDALPLACRQFPRVSVTDPRGVSVTLSHYCPTAASLCNDENDGNDDMERERDFIVVNASGFPSHGEYVGLDARTPLPPLLRQGLLMDWESWWEIERCAVDLLLGRASSAAQALAQLRSAVRVISEWSPASGRLTDRVREAFLDPAAEDLTSASDLQSVAFAAVPANLRSQAEWTMSSVTSDLAARRFLAAHAFANWTIHLGQGLRTWLRSVETVHCLLQAGAGVRHTDLVLRHLVDPKAWAAALDSSAT